MTQPTAQETAALARIEELDDPDKLRIIMKNAAGLGSALVEDAAFRKLVSVLPEGEPGTVEYDFWKSVYALEEMLVQERGKTVRLSRTRQKHARDGAVKTMADLAMKTEPSAGFILLRDLGRLDLTFEAVMQKHEQHFSTSVLETAQIRLDVAKVEEEAD